MTNLVNIAIDAFEEIQTVYCVLITTMEVSNEIKYDDINAYLFINKISFIIPRAMIYSCWQITAQKIEKLAKIIHG